jgi:hypothetical protein
MKQRSKREVKKRTRRAEPARKKSSAAPAPPRGPFPEPQIRSVEEMFAGPRPASFSRGLEPAFLLLERPLMDYLRDRAAALGLDGYDMLAKRILREHAHKY